jgi:23S rRNA pseudouridine2457 synthase
MYRHLLFYKPYNVLCQFTDSENPLQPRRTLKDFIPIAGVYAAGRLDYDSEGLLFLTNQGRLQHLLCDPQFAHPRTYWVQVEQIPDENALNRLRKGITIQNYQTRPAQVDLLPDDPPLPPRFPPIRYRQSIPTSWLEMTLTEGKNRQVRRMTAAVGFPTLRLVRVGLGLKQGKNRLSLSLEGLQPGQWRELTDRERQSLERLSF